MSRRPEHWYNVTFTKGSSLRSFMLPAACTGNAIATGWCRLEDAQGTREGWTLAVVSAVSDSCGGNECCGCKLCTPDDASEAMEALDIEPYDNTILEHLMFKELDLDCAGYSFPECPWDSAVGFECMKVLRKAQELTELMPDIDHSEIWHAAYHQCEVFYRG